MKKQIGTLTIGILMLAGVMAMIGCDIKFSGENCSFQINITDPVYTVIGNSSNLTGLNVSYENGNITILSDPLMATDNFTLIFFENQTYKVIEKVRTGGGGSSRTKYVDKNVTVYVPEYVDRNITTEVEVEKIVDRIEYQEEPTNYYYLLFALILGGMLVWGAYGFFGREEEYEEEE